MIRPQCCGGVPTRHDAMLLCDGDGKTAPRPCRSNRECTIIDGYMFDAHMYCEYYKKFRTPRRYTMRTHRQRQDDERNNLYYRRSISSQNYKLRRIHAPSPPHSPPPRYHATRRYNPHSSQKSFKVTQKRDIWRKKAQSISYSPETLQVGMFQKRDRGH